VSTPPQRFDAIVIGSSQSDIELAGALASAGKRTAFIEQQAVAGTLPGFGCSPIGAMRGRATAADWIQRAASYGIAAERPGIDWAAVRNRHREIAASFRAATRERLRQLAQLEWVEGKISFSGPHTIQVRRRQSDADRLQAETIVIDVGSRPTVPPVDGIEDVPTLDSASITELAYLPRHLAILGGGYVGVEAAQVFRRFGSTVTLVEREDRLLPHEDPDIAFELQRIFGQSGVTTRTGFIVTYLQQLDEQKLRVVGAQGTRGLVVLCTDILLAAGRAPETDGLHLERAGIETTDRGDIIVDDRLETSVPGVYAIDNVHSVAPFAGGSCEAYRLLRNQLIDGEDATTSGWVRSYIAFSDPQLGRAGLSELEAKGSGLDYRLAKMPWTQVDRGVRTDRLQGFVKALVDPASGRILGAAALGGQAGDLTSLLHLAMIAELPYSTLRDAPFAHPTHAAALNRLFSSWVDG